MLSQEYLSDLILLLCFLINNYFCTRTRSKKNYWWPNEPCWIEYWLLEKPLGNSSESGSPIVRFANPLVKVASGSGNLTGSPIAMNVPIGSGLGNLSSAALPALLCFNRILTRAGGCTRTCWRIGSIAAQLAWHQESSLWAGNDDIGHCHSEMVLMVGCRSGSARYTTEFLATGSTSWGQGSQVGTGW